MAPTIDYGLLKNLINRNYVESPIADLFRLAWDFVENGKKNYLWSMAIGARSVFALHPLIHRIPLNLQPAFFRCVDVILRASPKCVANRFLDNPLICLCLEYAKRSRFDLAHMPTATDSDIFCLYSSAVLSYGDQDAVDDLLRGKLVMLGVRRSTSTLANRGRGVYDDTLVVFPDGGLQLRKLNTFPLCTEPGAQYADRARVQSDGNGTARKDPRYANVKIASKTEGADINRDGIRDLGRLREGVYRYGEKVNGYLGARAFAVRNTQTVERDTNGDGWFTADDPQRVDSKNAGTSMYIHRGGDDGAEAVNTWSAGCQTIPKNRYSEVLNMVPVNSRFSYVLIDAS